MDVSNPFKLTHIKNMLRSDFDTVGPCVVMAAPGFMQVSTYVRYVLTHVHFTLLSASRIRYLFIFRNNFFIFLILSLFLSQPSSLIPFSLSFTPLTHSHSLPSPSPSPPHSLSLSYQTGVSRHLFERWCDDERNGVVLAGYTVEGTLAHDLLNHPTGNVLTNMNVHIFFLNVLLYSKKA